MTDNLLKIFQQSYRNLELDPIVKMPFYKLLPKKENRQENVLRISC